MYKTNSSLTLTLFTTRSRWRKHVVILSLETTDVYRLEFQEQMRIDVREWDFHNGKKILRKKGSTSPSNARKCWSTVSSFWTRPLTKKGITKVNLGEMYAHQFKSITYALTQDNSGFAKIKRKLLQPRREFV